MTLTVQDFPVEWYDLIQTQKYTLRPITQIAGRPWSGAGTAVGNRPHTQAWVSDVTMAPMADTMFPTLGPVLTKFDAFITRARGRSGVIRMSNALRLAPWYDRHLTATRSRFTDGSGFSDGSLFANGYLPPEVKIYANAARGTNYIVMSGFPASTSNVLTAGDLLQIKPSGIPGTVPHLYKAMYGGDSDSSGRIGIEIEPRLRQGIAVGDVVGLHYASTLFRLADDNQGEIEGTGAGIGNSGFSLVEALDLVP